MSRYVPIRFTDDESSLLERTFAASDETKISTHIKRVYFDAVRPHPDGMVQVLAELRRMSATVARLQESRSGASASITETSGRHADGGHASTSQEDDPQLMLSILCGLYVMVRKSVGESIRSQADQVLDASAIESFLRGQ